MKIIFICTNYDSIKCGIGMYTSNLVKELKKNKNISVDIISADVYDLKNIKRFFNIRLLKEIKKYIKDNKCVKDEKIKIIIEYPFMDWSIINLFGVFYLKRYLKNSIVILSIHEYFRVNFFRKKAVDFLIKLADSFIITDKNLRKILKNKVIIQRSIPSNIELIKFNPPIKKSDNEYCFFGLINKAKAFDEMICAWKEFNRNKKYTLNIYTSSDIKIDNYEDTNIKIFINLNNVELSKELQKNSVMILPIKPYIDNNNGSYKAGVEHGCIVIGKFKEINNKNNINIEDEKYSIENIKKALLKSTDSVVQRDLVKEKDEIETFEKIAKKILKVIKESEFVE